MNLITKKLIAGAVIVGAIVILYYGAFLPLRKGQFYIMSLKKISAEKPKSIDELNEIFRPALELKSPVGHYEATSAYLGTMFSILNQQDDRAVVDALIEKIEENVLPILEEEKKSFNYWQTIYTLGLMYRSVAIKFGDEIYYEKAEKAFKEGLEYSPNRPAFLYGLFDLYVAKGDNDNLKEAGNIILNYWPNDNEVKKMINF